MNPGFTVRRQLDEIRKESEQIEYLRNVSQSRVALRFVLRAWGVLRHRCDLYVAVFSCIATCASTFRCTLTRHILISIAKVIENRLKVKLPDDLPAALRDGVVLCHLANHIRPRSVSSIHVPSQLMVSCPACQQSTDYLLICIMFAVM